MQPKAILREWPKSLKQAPPHPHTRAPGSTAGDSSRLQRVWLPIRGSSHLTGKAKKRLLFLYTTASTHCLIRANDMTIMFSPRMTDFSEAQV